MSRLRVDNSMARKPFLGGQGSLEAKEIGNFTGGRRLSCKKHDAAQTLERLVMVAAARTLPTFTADMQVVWLAPLGCVSVIDKSTLRLIVKCSSKFLCSPEAIREFWGHLG